MQYKLWFRLHQKQYLFSSYVEAEVKVRTFKTKVKDM